MSIKKGRVNMIIAHKKTENGTEILESLEEHTDAVLCYYRAFIELEHIQLCLRKMILQEERKIVEYLMEQAIIFHDQGKKNPIFQNKIQNKNTEGKDSSHSYLSALMYMDNMKIFVKKEIEEDPNLNEERLLALVDLLVNNIKGHHTNLDSIYQKEKYGEAAKFYDSLDEYDVNIRSKLKEINGLVSEDFFVRENYEIKGIEKSYFYLAKLHYSLLINADFLATTDFFNGYKTTIEHAKEIVEGMMLKQSSIENAISIYEQKPLTKNIRNGNSDSEMNKIRTEIFKEVERSYYKRPFEKIYFLTAPTGAGKTNIGLNISLKIAQQQKKTKVIQVIPLNSVGEQTYQFISESLDNSTIRPEIINSSGIYNISDKNEKTTEWYDVYHLTRQMLGFEYVVTSHVRLFDSLFSNDRVKNLPLAHLCNSVIVIDEIQAYKEDKWFEIAYALNDIAEYYNITFIIMSATMVNLNQFVKKESYDLLEKKRYFLTHPVFKNRFEISDKYLKTVQSLSDLLNMVRIINEKGKRIVIEVETKKKAKALYQLLRESEIKKDTFLLTSDENRYAKNMIINALKKEDNEGFVLDDVILVGTSVIEFGIDIDFDIGIKQVTSLDAEEQFAGRINRSNKRSGILYLIDLDDAKRDHLKSSYRYRLDPQFTIYKVKDNSEQLRVLKEKEIDLVYSNIIEKIVNERNTRLMTIYENKDYKGLNECMQLIEPNNYQITYFIPYKHNELDGYKVYEQYNNILKNKDLSYGEKKIQLLEIQIKMHPFLFKASKNTAKSLGIKTLENADKLPFVFEEREDLLEDIFILDESYKKLKVEDDGFL